MCEIQFHHKLFYELKKENDYVYERARLFKCDDRNLAYDYVCKFLNQNGSKKLEYVKKRQNKYQKKRTRFFPH